MTPPLEDCLTGLTGSSNRAGTGCTDLQPSTDLSFDYMAFLFAFFREYIEHFSYGNADTDDLWKFLSKASGHDVATLMNAWIREMGFPIVRVSTIRTPKATEEGKTILSFKQERFNGIPPGCRGSRGQQVWSIPITGIYMRDGVAIKKFEVMLDKSSMVMELDGLNLDDPDCWLKINPRLTGFYRVRYSEDLFRNLFSNLSSSHLTSIDRMGRRNL